jgi:hypothetical protein
METRTLRMLLCVACVGSPTAAAAPGVRGIYGASYGSPLGWAGTGGLLIGEGCTDCGDAVHRGALAQVSAGQGGVKGSVGFGTGVLDSLGEWRPLGLSLNATVTRTWNNPVGLSGHGTYLGADLQLMFVGHVSVGVAKRVGGYTTREWLVTWTVGVGF